MVPLAGEIERRDGTALAAGLRLFFSGRELLDALPLSMQVPKTKSCVSSLVHCVCCERLRNPIRKVIELLDALPLSMQVPKTNRRI